MTIAQFLLAEFDREVARSRRVLAQAPEGEAEWKPHDRSMTFGYLVELVAIMPSWVAMQIGKDELDIAPAEGSQMRRQPLPTTADRLAALDKAAGAARAALGGTTDEHLATTWKLKARGAVVQEDTRAAMIQDTLNHWAHHRGQLTVYLRLLGATVPSVYGPTADDTSFG